MIIPRILSSLCVVLWLTAPSCAETPWKNILLPGQDEFVFTLYGPTSDPEQLQSLIDFMSRESLGNGFDPGPTSRATSRRAFEVIADAGWPVICYPGYGDFQTKEGSARLTEADEAAIRVLDDAGVFSGIQLGEWGYYFHNLSMNRQWWKGVYGDRFAENKYRIKPANLRGYDTRPKTREECYEVLKDYFVTRNRYMNGRNISVTGHSHYETYAAEWGARLIGLEIGENIAFAQSKMAFARGASRQFNVPWSSQISPWFHGSCTTRGALRMDGIYARGLDAGHSLSLYRRMWLHSWFAGAAMVTPENSANIFFEHSTPPWKLTPQGEEAAKVFSFMRAHERGVPLTPLVVILDRLNGYNGYQGRPWGILPKTPGDEEVEDLFEHQLFPDTDYIHSPPDPENPEGAYLVATPFGETMDVMRSNASSEVLKKYPLVLLVGDITFDDDFVARLMDVARSGSRILLNPRHAEALGGRLESLQEAGTVEILPKWTDPDTGRAAPISDVHLGELLRQELPVRVEGDPIQYQINTTDQGWVVELVNNRGVVKFPTTPAVLDSDAIASVTLVLNESIREAREWISDSALTVTKVIHVTIPAGSTAFVELIRE
jgi:hypothetical protein